MRETRNAVIMARGLGTRMRRPDTAAALSDAQARAADTGVKAMIPVGRTGPSGQPARPFLDYVLSGLADAGFAQVCLVVGPEHVELSDYYRHVSPPERLRLAFAVQERPLGTADAVLAAREFGAGDLFLVINSDNYYPVEALRAMRQLGRPGLAAFEAGALVREGNFERDRVARFALVRFSEQGELRQVIEKPGESQALEAGGARWVSMNCWLFGPAIFDACARVRPSVRGELELTDAVAALVAAGERFRVVTFRMPVLDLTSRADISDLTRMLRRVDARP
jgi:dTDP-glucose pyrophosphorylase